MGKGKGKQQVVTTPHASVNPPAGPSPSPGGREDEWSLALRPIAGLVAVLTRSELPDLGIPYLGRAASGVP